MKPLLALWVQLQCGRYGGKICSQRRAIQQAVCILFPSEWFLLTKRSDPESWTTEELRRWLDAVRPFLHSPALLLSERASLSELRDLSRKDFWSPSQRNLHPNPKDSKEELLERVKANLRVPRTWKKKKRWMFCGEIQVMAYWLFQCIGFMIYTLKIGMNPMSILVDWLVVYKIPTTQMLLFT
jgi:hypothetical protein